MNRTLLIDGDIVLYKAASSLSNSYDFGDIKLSSVNVEEMKRRVQSDIESILDLTECTEYIFVLSDSRNFRKELYPTYKTNRKAVGKPEGYQELKDWCELNLKTVKRERLEGDDVMGIIATKYPDSYAIFSIDKDMKTIPTVLWDFQDGHFYEQSELEAKRFLYFQALMGDPTDGYKGCPRVGKIGAKNLLRECKDELDMLLVTLCAYFKAYGYGDEAVDKFKEQIGQARILTDKDYKVLCDTNTTYDPTSLLRRS